MCVKVGGEGKGEEFVYSEGKGEGKAFNRERKVKKKKVPISNKRNMSKTNTCQYKRRT